MQRLRRLSWFERIRTGPSPDDDALLQIARELATLFDLPFWYTQVVWGKFDRAGSGWMISKPVFFSPRALTFRGTFPEAELMLPEYLKGKLSVDLWRPLIALHLVRFKANISGRMSRQLGKTLLIPIGAVIPALTLSAIVGGPFRSIVFFAAWVPSIPLSFLYARKGMILWEFELDREVADKLGMELVLETLKTMSTLDPRANRSKTLDRFLAYWNPSINQRISELQNPQPIATRRPSRIPKITLRTRAIIIGIGVAVYWASGVTASALYSQGRPSFACVSNGCGALVVTAGVAYWLSILVGISLVIGVVQRFRHRQRTMN